MIPGATLGDERNNHNGLAIKNYMVGNELVLRDRHNWNAESIGKLDFVDDATWELYGNTPPVARAGEDMTISFAGGHIILDGSLSNDPDGDQLSYSWTLAYPIQDADKAIAYIDVPPQQIVGTIAVTLHVEDPTGQSDTDSMNIIVDHFAANFPSLQIKGNFAAANQAGSDWHTPITMTLVENHLWEASIQVTNPSRQLKFDVTGDWSWNYGDNEQDGIAEGSGGNIQLSHLVGNHVIRFNDESLSYSITHLPDNIAPTAVAGDDLNLNTEQHTINLDGASSFDTDGHIVSYLWQQISGNTLQISNASNAVASISIPSQETGHSYEFQLTVTDDKGLQSTDNIWVHTIADVQYVNVTFTCHNGWTNNGTSVFIVGNSEHLGNWSVVTPIQKLNGQTHPVWTGSIALPSNTAYEWKCVKAVDNNNSGNVYGQITTWQNGVNNAFMTEETDTSASGSF